MREESTLELCEVKPEHMDGLFEQYSHPDSIHMAAFVFGDPFDREAFNKRLDRLLADPEIVYRSIVVDNAAIGAIASYMMEGKREVTYGIHPDYWDQGITSVALDIFLEEVETRRPLHARAASDNAPSLRILEKCGFRRTGTEVNFAPARLTEIEETICVLT